MKQNLGVETPPGIKASIMGAIDRVMKEYSEGCLAQDAPIGYLDGIIAKPFADRARFKKMTNWKTFQATVQCGKHTVIFSGGLDELLEFPDGSVAAWDFKSNGKPRDWNEYIAAYYQTQGDMYDAILIGNGFKTQGKTYFTFTWPTRVREDGAIQFVHATVAMETSAERVQKLAEAAIDCLKGPMPAPQVGCDYCTYVSRYAQAMQAHPEQAETNVELPMDEDVSQAPAPKRGKGKS